MAKITHVLVNTAKNEYEYDIDDTGEIVGLGLMKRITRVHPEWTSIVVTIVSERKEK